LGIIAQNLAPVPVVATVIKTLDHVRVSVKSAGTVISAKSYVLVVVRQTHAIGLQGFVDLVVYLVSMGCIVTNPAQIVIQLDVIGRVVCVTVSVTRVITVVCVPVFALLDA
jgi:hypothetical protein